MDGSLGASIGRQIWMDDRYEVIGFSRAGRFGDLWRARRKEDGALVTIKLLKPELFKDGEAIRRFQREVRLLLSFTHPCLLPVLDCGTTSNGDPFLVLQQREGRLLSEIVARGPLSVAEARQIGAQIAHVLAAASERGIVHRGLCASAILLSDDGGAAVLDFGLARVFFAEEEDTSLTEHGQRLGDPAYMAPEYIQAFTSDARTDLYALGALLYEMLTGDPPFLGRPLEVLDAHVSRAAAPPSERTSEIPPWLDALVLDMLAKDPLDRPDATAVADALIAGRWPYAAERP